VRRLNELEPGVIPAALATLLFIVLGAKDAGYAASVWYPSAVFLAALLAVSVWAFRGTSVRYSRAAVASVAFLAALTLWTYVSIAWSDVTGDALDGANRSLLYLVVYVLFLFLAPSAGAFAALLAGYVLAIAGIGLYELVAASRAANPDAYFLVARFAEPTGYQNANCALFSLAFWPALFLASRRQVPVPLRAFMLGAAGVCVELAVLSQSRGWLAAMPIVYVLYVALVPGRVRSLAFTVPVAIAALAAQGPLLDVYSALRDGVAIRSALDDAWAAIVVSGLALAGVGLVMALADRWLDPRGAVARRLTFVTASTFAAAAAVGLVVTLVWLGNPATRIRDAWDGFKGRPHLTGSYLTSGFSSNRYDLWRVAWHEFEHAPVQGVGSDQFAVDYLRERRSDEEPLYPHSVELKVLAQTGIVGGVLFLGFLVTAVTAWARRREESAFARASRAAALVAFAYWLVHGSVDWFWELAGLGAPAIAFLAFAVGGGAPRRNVAAARSRALSLVAIPSLVLALVLFVPPWLSAKEVRAASGQWREDPAAAFDRLDRARRLNPLSDWPDVVAGAIASRIGDERKMIASFRRALERNPTNWYSHLELAVAYGRRGERSAALRELRQVERLNPYEPTIQLVRAGLRSGRPVSTRELDAIFLRRTFVSNRER
jgi:O-Antigen ligase